MLFTTSLLTILIGSAKIYETTAVDTTTKTANLRATRADSDQKYNCSTGCPDIVDPVCANGVTYQNECLAVCQGVQGLESRSCNDQDSSRAPIFTRRRRKAMETFSDMESIIDHEVMHRFAGDGFKYVGSVENTVDTPLDGDISDKAKDRTLGASTRIPQDSSDSPGGHSVLVTPSGDMYIACEESKSSFEIPEMNDHFNEDSRDPAAESEIDLTPPPPLPVPESTNNNGDIRTNSVIGRDTRFRVGSSPGWAYWRIVYVSGCSGTIVGKNKVLTNAHCVYDFSGRRWRAPSTVTPGKNPDDPWGSWNVETARIHNNYFHSGDRNYDYAILTIKNDNWSGQHIGDYMGFFPIVSTTCAVLDSTNVKKRIVGYPGDKQRGTMWNSGRCDDWSYSCGSRRVYHRCDTFNGNSGSGMFLVYPNLAMEVIGVHAFGAGVGSWNSGPAFTPEVARMLKTW